MSNSPKSGRAIYVVWDGEAFRPFARYDEELCAELPKNTNLRAAFSRPRNIPRHRLYRVVLRLVVHNTDKFATEEALHKTLLVGCGVVEPVITVQGEILMIPSSTAFEAMPEDEFKSYFDDAMRIIETHVIPGVDLSLLLKEAREQANWKEKEAA